MRTADARLGTPVLPTAPLYRLPRPDRLYQRWLPARHRSTLSDEGVEAIISGYGLSLAEDGIARAMFGRGESIVLATSAGKKVLKRYKPNVDEEAIRHEHSLLTYLAQIHFPAPRLVRTATGNTYLRFSEDEHYALFDYLDGYFHYHNYLFSPAQTRQFIYLSGKSLAALHLALRDATPEGRNVNGFRMRNGSRWRDLDYFLELLDSCFQIASTRSNAALTDLLQEFKRVEDTLVELDDYLRRADPPRLIIHGDYGPYNLLFKANHPVVILDFELARLDWRLTDFANGIPSFAQNRLGFSFNKMRTFLEGYRSLLPLEHDELALLPVVWQFLALRRAIVCCYRFARTDSSRWAREARERLELAEWAVDHRQAMTTPG